MPWWFTSTAFSCEEEYCDLREMKIESAPPKDPVHHQNGPIGRDWVLDLDLIASGIMRAQVDSSHFLAPEN
jgi:hypothetical protein